MRDHAMTAPSDRGTAWPGAEAARRTGDQFETRPETEKVDGPPPSTPFRSILFRDPGDARDIGRIGTPEYFGDLNLDQIVTSITAAKQDYNLRPFFYAPLRSVEAVKYRHEVMRDLEESDILDCIQRFAAGMRLMRERLALAEKLYYSLQKQRWFLAAAEAYCDAVTKLQDRLPRLSPHSTGLRSFCQYLNAYASSTRFAVLTRTVGDLVRDLTAIRYCVQIRGSGFTVRGYEAEQDYSAEVTETFAKFRQGEARDYRAELRASRDMNHIEAKILEFVSLLNEDIFARMTEFATRQRAFADTLLLTFDREIQFYVAYLDHLIPLRKAGLGFCYPELSTTDKQVRVDDAFDLALANKLTANKSPVICNEFHLDDPERIFVVSGPNQGGKTTFSRTFGQMHHLASIGCPVPGRNAKLFLFDAMFTHYERAEAIANLHGKLQDDLLRIHAILERATPRSIIIMNEIFTSTTLMDAVFLARKVMERIIALDCLCVCVTFLEELASLGEKTVSMVSTVARDDTAQRTFKVIRRPADGRAYAISIAEKYRLTYDAIKGRIAP